MSLLPLFVLSSAAVIFTILGLFVTLKVNRSLIAGTLITAIVVLLLGWGQYTTELGGLYRVDGLSQSLTLVSLLGVLWFVLIGRSDRWEYPVLALYAGLGMHMMASTSNLVVMLIALEAFSLPLYVLATWRRDERGFEAGLKYFLLGALAAAVFLYGIALHFGATGSFEAGAPGSGLLYGTAILLMLSAFAFKVSLVPFQWWTPDVYQGSPTAVTLMMATAVKAAGFAALARILNPGQQTEWAFALAALVILTVVFGNLGALAQSEAKRLLAYSSIAHAGYVALALFGATSGPSIAFYLFSYALATGIAFAVLAAISNHDVPLERLSGLWGRNRLLGLGMALALLSLAGLPPFAGFWGKYLVFQQAALAGQYVLVVLALITSAIAAYYYLRMFALVVFGKAHPENEESLPGATAVSEAGYSVANQPIRAKVGGSGAWAMSVAIALIAFLGVLPGLGYSVFAGPAGTQPLGTAQDLSITSPSAGAVLNQGSFSLQGTGKPGERLEIADNGLRLGEAVVGGNGGWSFPVPASITVGDHTLSARRADGSGAQVQVRIQSGQNLRPLTFISPAEGSQIPATPFTMQGTGPVGQEVEVLQDGVSLGRAVVDSDGLWNFQVPTPEVGVRLFEARLGDQSIKLGIEILEPTPDSP